MEDDRYVRFIRITQGNGNISNYKIQTERSGSPLSVETDKHEEELDVLIQEYSLDELVVEDVREWYDTYLVPKLHNAFAVMEL